MADVETVIYARLAAYGGLTALVSTRIWPLFLHKDDTLGRVILPAVTYQRIDGPREQRFGADPVAYPRIEVSSWAETYAGAKAVATQVRGALQLWRTAETDPEIMDSDIESDEDIYESDVGLFRVRADYIVTHPES